MRAIGTSALPAIRLGLPRSGQLLPRSGQPLGVLLLGGVHLLGGVLLLVPAGCSGTSAAPDEIALDRFETANGMVADRRYEEAIPHYQFVVAKRDRLKDAWHRLAYCLEKMGRTSEAIAAYEGALRVDRQDGYALKHLARLYTHMGFLDEAIGAGRTLVALRGGDKKLEAEIARLEALKGER